MAQSDNNLELAALETNYEHTLNELELKIYRQHLHIIQEASAKVIKGKAALEAESLPDQRVEIYHYTRHELVPQLEEQLRDRLRAGTRAQIRRRMSQLTRDHIQSSLKAKHDLRAHQEWERLSDENIKQKAELHRRFYQPVVRKLRKELGRKVAQLQADTEYERKVQLLIAENKQKREVLLKSIATELKKRASQESEAVEAQLRAEWQELQAQIDPMTDQKLEEVCQQLGLLQEQLLRLVMDCLYDHLDAQESS